MKGRLFATLSRHGETCTRWVLVVVVLVMLVVTGFQVTSRYFFNYSIFWTEELVRYLFVWSAFLGGSLAFKHGTHLAIDLLFERIKRARGPIKGLTLTVYHGTILLSLGVVTYYGVEVMLSNIPKLSIAMEISMALPYLCVPLGGLLMIVHHLAVLEDTLAPGGPTATVRRPLGGNSHRDGEAVS